MKIDLSQAGPFLRKWAPIASLILNVLGGAGVIPPVLAPVLQAVVTAVGNASAPAPAAPAPVLDLVK